MNDAAPSNPMPSGMGSRRAASVFTSSAKAPKVVKAITLSPGLTFFTSGPTSFTTPASSLPGEKGSGSLNWYLAWMMSTSGKLTLAAFTDTTTSPGPALGEATSSKTSESGGPNCLQRMAFMDSRILTMPRLKTDDGVALHYEEAGAGIPLVLVHEFAGDHRSWEPQGCYFSRRYRRVV